MDLPIKEVEEMQCSRQKEEKGIPLNPPQSIPKLIMLHRQQSVRIVSILTPSAPHDHPSLQFIDRDFGIYLDVSLIRIQTTEFHVQFIHNL